jgi:hypothetical protein
MSDQDFTRMMQLVQSDPEAGRQLMAETLRAQAASNPQLAAMMEMMARQQTPAIAPARDPSRAHRIREAIQDMREELVELHQRNEDLADALGACSVCWGRVKHCSECRGRGRPGWREPDPELFEEFVAPVINKRGEP